MVNFLLVMLIRFASMVLHEILDQEFDSNLYFEKGLPILLNICELLSWISLSLFVFEMKTIRNRLETESHQDFQVKEKSNRKFRMCTIGFLLFYGITITLGAILEHEISDWLVITDMILRSLKFIVDLYLFWLFITNFVYFVRLKKERLEAKERNFSSKNVFIIGWTVTLLVLCLYQSVGAIVIGFLEYIYKDKIELKRIHEFIGKNDRYVFPIKDFLVLVTMLYLFYEQGKRIKREDRLKSESENQDTQGNADDKGMRKKNKEGTVNTVQIKELLMRDQTHEAFEEEMINTVQSKTTIRSPPKAEKKFIIRQTETTFESEIGLTEVQNEPTHFERYIIMQVQQNRNNYS
ncbi:hypothetical protein FGO68_gene8979 [Halteria grandinella]|uniref:Gustatory receptor n=1 Tax=Halteria grandinella TaxID=5974 RepID=A0A8J8T5Q1_HALGN|nr:hypothetical protein FGO68_gene8979 [Halteria grandinella]